MTTDRTRKLALAVACVMAFAPVSAMAATSPTPIVPAVAATPDPTMPKPAPVLVVRAYKTSMSRVLVGMRFNLTLDIQNATARRADNVVISLQSGTSAASAAEAAVSTGGGLSVMGSGNAKFVGTIKGSKSQSVTFDVMAGPGTAAGTYNVPVIIAFEYNGERQEITQTIGIVVERDATFSVVTAELPKDGVVGVPFDASFELANTGGFALSAVTLSVEATGATVTDGKAFLGTFEAAGSEAIDVQVTPEKAGTLDVVLVVSYRDDFGRTKTFSSPYKVTVTDQPKDTGESAPGTSGDKTKDDKNPFVAFIMALFGLGS
ncbi:MAG: hypothetical protein Q8S43_02875 [Actinomycetota bacterium]|nr:hypothetical protein [Actinomycetota bacterium]